MADTSIPYAELPKERFAESDFRAGQDFRAGHVFSQTFSVLWRNLLPFGLVAAVADLPNALLFTPGIDLKPAGTAGLVIGIAGALTIVVLSGLSQAVVLYGALDDMRGRPVDLAESVRVGLRRFVPVLGLSILVMLLITLGFLAVFVPGLMAMTILAVAVPACVVERLGPIKSMKRSAELTKGYRWRVFGIWFAELAVGILVQAVLQRLATAIGGAALTLIVLLLWNAVFGGFNAVMAAVIYRDLRVAKEGVDTEQIASVFD